MNYKKMDIDLDKIGPVEDDFYNKTQPSKIVVMGKAGTGKSFVIKSLLYHFRDKINQGVIISSTEDSNNAYGDHFPSLFIYNEYSETAIQRLIDHQKALIKAKVKNPWSILVIDDCAFDKKFFTSTLQMQLFKNARHWFILYVLAIQFARDIPPTIRAAIDMTFILREHNMQIRRIIYDNYGSIIPSFLQFVEIMAKATRNYGVLVIDNMSSTDNWEDNVLTYRAPIIDEEYWKFGCNQFWYFGDQAK